MYFRKVLLLVCCLVAVVASAKIYHWIDDSGNETYSDAPDSSQSKEIKLQPLPKYNTPVLTAVDQPLLSENPAQVMQDIVYTTFELVAPINEATIWSNSGELSLLIDVVPELMPEDKLIIFLDGTALRDSYNDISIELTGIDKGKHTLYVELHAKNSQVIYKTKQVTFDLRTHLCTGENCVKKTKMAPKAPQAPKAD
ncbi:MAG: DUF4124 domain-containing protein [Psychromonas sp.]